MKRISLLLAGFLIFQSSTVKLTELSAEERKSGIAYLQETSDYFTTKVKGLSDAQLDFKTASENWSIRQCMEHIALTEPVLYGMIGELVKRPANPEKKSESKFTDEQMKTATVDRSKKAQAPEMIQPKNTFKTADETIENFLKARKINIDYIATTRDDLRNHLQAHPFFGMLDGYQWMLLIAAHSKRHTLQIEEVMAAPGFPKS